MIGEDGAQAHGTAVEDALVTQTAEAAMAVDDLDALADEDVAEDGEAGEHRGEGGVAVDDEEGHMVDLEAVGEVADALAVVVGVGDDDDFVATVDELGRELVDVRLYASRLREEEVADHGDVVSTARHRGGVIRDIGVGEVARTPVMAQGGGVFFSCRRCAAFAEPRGAGDGIYALLSSGSWRQ